MNSGARVLDEELIDPADRCLVSIALNGFNIARNRPKPTDLNKQMS
jgi:hypothetical protein